MRVSLRIVAALAALFVSTVSYAQSVPAYPARPVRIIVPYPAGGPTDLIARLVAQKLSEGIGGNFYVENVVGAGGNIGHAAAANAAGDGHTLAVVTNDFAIAVATTAKLPYDPIKQFAPVSIIASSPQVVIVNSAFPAKTVAELVTLAKADPGKYSAAGMSLGFGMLTSQRFFRLGLNVDLIRVPFTGAAPLITSTIGNHTPIAFIGLPPAVPMIKEGKLRPLVVVSAQRSPEFPDVPTNAEVGVPDQDADLLISMVATGGTPKPIVDLLQREIIKIVAMPDVKQRLSSLTFTAIASTPDQYSAKIRADIDTWRKVVSDLGITVE